MLLARNLLIDGEASYLLELAELEATWNSLPRAEESAYPFRFSAEERKGLAADVEGVARGMEAMRTMKEAMGELFPEQGIVSPEHYEESRRTLLRMKYQVIQKYASTEQEREVWQKMWPFGD